MEFVIPNYPDDLEVLKAGRYCVTNVTDLLSCKDVDAFIEGEQFEAVAIQI
jgi:hypothetical protein